MALRSAGLGAALVLASASCAPKFNDLPAVDSPPPVYTRAQIRAFSPYGVYLGLDAESACRILLNQGFVRHQDDLAGSDCTARKSLDEDDSFFGDSILALGDRKVRTEFGTVFYVSLHYRDVGARREVAEISIWTHEKNQEEALDAATRAEWGEPTFYAKWGYRVLNYAESPSQADYENRSSYDSCGYLPECKQPEERRRCIGVRRKYAAASLRVVVFDWGRTINISDQTGSQSFREIERIDRSIRSGRLAVACPVHRIH